MTLQVYPPDRTEGLFLHYETFVRDLAEVAVDWPTLDREERSDHQVVLMEVWGKRRTLGQLYQTHQLTRAQEARLAQLDYLLLEQAALMERCFGFGLDRLLTIFRWGSPLAQSTQTVRIETAMTSLNQIAQALAPAN
ncbi:MAG: hypothetical protein U0350_03880 [Caldilineaceae bacterium]